MGSGMEVGGRTGGVVVMNATVWVRSAIWVGEMQLGGMTGRVMVMNVAVWVRSVVWVGEMQLGERTDGVMVKNTASRLRLAVAPLFRSNPIGGSKSDPGCSDATKV